MLMRKHTIRRLSHCSVSMAAVRTTVWAPTMNIVCVVGVYANLCTVYVVVYVCDSLCYLIFNDRCVCVVWVCVRYFGSEIFPKPVTFLVTSVQAIQMAFDGRLI